MSAVLGWLVGVIDVGQFLPQARRTVLHRHDAVAMRGLSVWTWAIATTQGAAWIVYGFANELWAIAIPNLVITPVCALILVARLRHGRAYSDGSSGGGLSSFGRRGRNRTAIASKPL